MVAALLQTAATPVLLHPSIPHPSTSWYTFRDGAEAAVCVYTHTHTHTESFTLPGEDVCCYGYRQKRTIMRSMNYASEVGGAYMLFPACRHQR